ncbi:unnamed protein product [Rhizophagus irregularis]|nr:unnamed protein product [Rhizophagus irregularis]
MIKSKPSKDIHICKCKDFVYRFLSVLGRWIYGFRLSVLGLWIYGFQLSVGLWIYGFRLSVGFGYMISAFGWALDIWVQLSVLGFWTYRSVLGFWIGFHFKLILNRSDFHFEFLVGFSFGLLLNGFLFQTFVR